MSPRSDKRLLVVWLALSAVTLAQLGVGSVAGRDVLTPNAAVTAGAIVIALVKVRVILRETLQELTNFGDGGRQPGQFYAVHSIATDSKGNLYTTETYAGRRVQKMVAKGIGTVPRKEMGVPWPATTGQ